MEKHFLYICSAPTYGCDEIVKVGISNNPFKRIEQLHRFERLFKFKSIFYFQNPKVAKIIEDKIVDAFSNKPYEIPKSKDFKGDYVYKIKGREYFLCDCNDVEILAESIIKDMCLSPQRIEVK